MTLIFDLRRKLQGEPGLHALIAGVSAYPYQQERSSNRRTGVNFHINQMARIDSAARTAYKIYHWLLERRKYLPVPLASIRLLVSPSSTEENEIYDAQPKLREKDAHCTWVNFYTAANQWQEDASSHADNMTFFYFAGHGIELSRNTQALLLEDCGNPDHEELTKAADFMSIYEGMKVSTTRPNMAKTQLYFVDTCRQRFDQQTKPSPVFHDILNKHLDRRFAPIFYATSPGCFAHTIRGEQTVFSKALLNFLEDYGGEKIENDEDSQGQVKRWKWHVTFAHLQDIQPQITELINQLRGSDEPELEQDMMIDKYTPRKTTFVYLDKPPKTNLILKIDPHSALDHIQVQIKNGKKPIPLAAPIHPNLYKVLVPCIGKYEITAKVEPPHSDFVYKSQKIAPPLKRPDHPVRLKMTSP